jgi:hypothetical protein
MRLVLDRALVLSFQLRWEGTRRLFVAIGDGQCPRPKVRGWQSGAEHTYSKLVARASWVSAATNEATRRPAIEKRKQRVSPLARFWR